MATATAAQTALGVVDRVLGKATGRLRGYPGMRALIAAFHRSVRDGLPPPVPFRDGLAVVTTLETIARVPRTRRDAVAERPEGAGVKVLVTGATGDVGRHVTDRLLADGVAVRALCRSGPTALPGAV